jgi:phosphoserine phosphatase
MKKMNSIKRIMSVTLLLVLAGLLQLSAQTFTFNPIKGFTDVTNGKLQAFLESTVPMKIRKVAVFDCDGTLFGQAPHYLADEALFAYAKDNYAGKTDAKSKEKMKIIDQLLHGNNVGVDYVQNRIRFLSGLTPEQIKNIGNDMYHMVYQNKMYPEMKALIQNLKNFDFEVWIISASPELLYQRFCAEQLGIPEDRILGVKSLVTADNIATDQLVFPVPQDNGKAEVVNTFVKATPLFAGGNSRGDMEMMNTSKGLKIMLNPDATKADKAFGGKTAKAYWEADPNCIIEYSNDVPEGNYKYVCDEWGVKKNASNPKASPVVIQY